jgi:hypothetical protein
MLWTVVVALYCGIVVVLQFVPEVTRRSIVAALVVAYGLWLLFGAAVMHFTRRQRFTGFYSRSGAIIMGLSLVAGISAIYLVP